MTRFSLLSIFIFVFLHTGASASEGSIATAEGMDSFSGLKALYLEDEGITLYYDQKKSEVLSGKHPEATYNDKISRPLRTQLLGMGKGYFTIDCDYGLSADPNCTFFQEINGKLKKVIQLQGLHFAFPGNGNIYVDGHTNTMFDVRQKYEWHNGSFSLVKQPFNFVGLNTTTRVSISLFSTQEYKQSVATLPKGSAILVVINEGEHYLVKSPFGLVGWVRIPNGAEQKDSPIDGIFYAGD